MTKTSEARKFNKKDDEDKSNSRSPISCRVRATVGAQVGSTLFGSNGAFNHALREQRWFLTQDDDDDDAKANRSRSEATAQIGSELTSSPRPSRANVESARSRAKRT